MKIRWRRDRLATPVFLGFPCGSAGIESPGNVEVLGSILGWEDPLEKGKSTHSSILAWRIPWTIWNHKELDMTEWLSLSLFTIMEWGASSHLTLRTVAESNWPCQIFPWWPLFFIPISWPSSLLSSSSHHICRYTSESPVFLKIKYASPLEEAP